MNVIYSPIHLITGSDPEPEIRSVQQFLGGDRIERNKVGPRIQDFYLLGPQRQENIAHVLNRLGVRHEIPADHEEALGWGIWMPPDADYEAAPLVQVFQSLPQLAARPIMLSEHRLRGGELLVVPRDCEFFVIVTSITGGPLSPELGWFMWSGKAAQKWKSQTPRRPVSVCPPIAEPGAREVTEGRLICVSRPWLTHPTPGGAPLTSQAASFQLMPMLDAREAAELAGCITRGPWARRVGDIYTQDGLDIVGWAKESGCPPIVKHVVDLVHAPGLVDRVRQLTGVQVEALREMFAYRLRAGDRILVHADTTYEGELLVRANWLLQAPEPPTRPWDFRFWNPEQPEAPVVVYAAQPNRAVFFLFGDDNPHDVPVIPEGAADRINIVISFGRAG